MCEGWVVILLAFSRRIENAGITLSPVQEESLVYILRAHFHCEKFPLHCPFPQHRFEQFSLDTNIFNVTISYLYFYDFTATKFLLQRSMYPRACQNRCVWCSMCSELRIV